MIGFETFVVLVFFVAILGLIIFVIFEMNATKLEHWQNMTVDKTSCELIAKNLKIERDEQIKSLMVGMWDESDCDDLDSGNWRGDDWKYVKPESVKRAELINKTREVIEN